nr:peroxidase family protein [Rhodopirellula maiorica]
MKSLRRRMKPETLEPRQLLAATVFDNELIPENTSQDDMSPVMDASTIVNRLNGNPSSDFVPVQTSATNSEYSTSERAIEIRSIDGTGNNLANPALGTAGTDLIRLARNDYADGVAEPAGEDRRSAREISNAISAADIEGITSERDLTSFVFLWSQFLDHDIGLSLEPENAEDAVAFDIEVPSNDFLFDPLGTGDVSIRLTRSEFAEGTGTSIDNPAEQVNATTIWIDGSQIYGSNQEVADSLREFAAGRLLIRDDGLLRADDEGNLLAGDIRAAENIGLTSLYTLFVREHNRLADEISEADPELTDEEIYQQARAIVIAELQSITYNEYLPALLGEDVLDPYEGYDASVDPSMSNEFSTAAFRFGYSTLNDTLGFYGNDGLDAEESIPLPEAFFNAPLLEETGIDSVLKAEASTLSQETNLKVVDGLRNIFFEEPGSGGLDLVSLIIQRGRDHGLADLNSVREAIGLAPYESFAEITSDVELQDQLETLYSDVNDIDLWVGLLAEDHAEGSSLGETSTHIIADQFERLRDGDRLYYENTMTDREIGDIENMTLADLIELNTNNSSLQSNVFFFTPSIAGTIIADSDSLATEQLAIRDGFENQDDGQASGDRQPSTGVAGVTLELLDREENLVETTITDSDGNYQFNSFDRSGKYQVRIAASSGVTVIGSDSINVLIRNGDSHLENINFAVMV